LRELEVRRLPRLFVGRSRLIERQKAFIMRHPAREGHADIKGAQGEQGWRKFLFLRRLKTQRHIVHQPLGRHHPGKALRVHLLGRKKRGWVDHLVGVGEGKPLVQGEQVVQVGRAAAPVPEDEERLRVNTGRGDERAKLAAFATGIPGVEQAGHRDKRRPVPVSRGNREAILAQQPPPRARSDASQVVMRQAPAMPERGGHPD
jgi:hypothetical protein